MGTSTAIVVLNLLLILLILKGVQNGSMKFTFKKFILGLLTTILVINLLMLIIS
jgi:hypothetical protein